MEIGARVHGWLGLAVAAGVDLPLRAAEAILGDELPPTTYRVGVEMGTGVGGFPLDEAARVTVAAVRDELPGSPGIDHVIFAMRGAAAYQAFEAALAATASSPIGPSAGGGGGGRAMSL